MNTSELCVWECQGTIRDTLGTSALIKSDPNHRSAFFLQKKDPTPRMTQDLLTRRHGKPTCRDHDILLSRG